MIEDFESREGDTVPKHDVLLALNHLGTVNSNKKDYLLNRMSDGGFGAPLVLDNTIESHYLKPQLTIENSPSKTVRKIDEIQHISVENSDEVPIKVKEQRKEDRENMRRAQQRIKQEELDQQKEIANLRRIASEKEQEEQLRQLREDKNKRYQKAEEVSKSTKFENPTELITAFEAMEKLTQGTSSEITPEVLRIYNNLRMSFKKGHANRVVKMDPIIAFLDENRETYNELKRKHKPTTSIEPTTRFGKGTIVKGSDLLTSKSEILPPIEEKRGGGGAVKILGSHKNRK
jgi:hypothetical protein